MVQLIKRGCFSIAVAIVIVFSGGGVASAQLLSVMPSTPKKYVSLGDSVAAGLGMPYKADATAEDQACGRSAQAYSEYAVQRLKEAHILKNVSCQGAKVKHLTSPQTVGTVTAPSQLDAAFAGGKPHLMTLTVGANDVNYSSFINDCINNTCDTVANTNAANTLLAQLNVSLRTALTEINARSGGQPPTVVITGYYYPFSLACPAVVPQLTLTEILWINQQVDKIHATLKSVAADYSFVKYAQPNFLTHELCSLFPWIQGPGEAAPLHPNYLGQQAISNAVIGRLYPLTLGL